MQPLGTLIPLLQEYYGEISQEELQQFLERARKALTRFKLSLQLTISADQTPQKELWANTDDLEFDAYYLQIVDNSGDNGNLDMHWEELTDQSEEELFCRLIEAYGRFI